MANYDGSVWKVYNTLNSELPENRVNTIVIDKNDRKWIGSENGMAIFDGTNWTIYNTDNSVLPK